MIWLSIFIFLLIGMFAFVVLKGLHNGYLKLKTTKTQALLPKHTFAYLLIFSSALITIPTLIFFGESILACAIFIVLFIAFFLVTQFGFFETGE